MGKRKIRDPVADSYSTSAVRTNSARQYVQLERQIVGREESSHKMLVHIRLPHLKQPFLENWYAITYEAYPESHLSQYRGGDRS